jgi:predicted ATPase
MNEERKEQLNRIVIKGFKSIKECELDLNSVNVLIGANGAGKSNFISVFEMRDKVLAKELSLYAQKKGINPLFYNGKSITDSIYAEFDYGSILHSFELEWTEADTLFFREEQVYVDGKNILGDGGYNESKALHAIRSKGETQAYVAVKSTLPVWGFYQFHNTSPSSRIKSENNISNSIRLISDARNLAAFLYRLKQSFPKEYNDILCATQLVAPFFDDFVLEPKELNEEQIILKWRKKGCEDVFNASQFSDGTLRFICLATLLLQPTELQPSTIIIDEPELGLHPFAITILAEMVQKAAVNKQVILATQSVELLDHFDVEDIIVVDNGENGSAFKRLNEEQLKLWLDNDYTLGEMWNKNIFGGRP